MNLLISASVIIVIAIVLDQITKALAVQYLEPVGTFPLIKGVFHLTYVENDGAIGGIFGGSTIFFVAATVIISVLFIIAIIKFNPCLFDKVAMAFIIAGGLGNMLDRFFRNGVVVDFFDFRLINFYVFNVADIFVTVGIIMLVVSTLFMKKSLYNKIEEYLKNKKSKETETENDNEL